MREVEKKELQLRLAVNDNNTQRIVSFLYMCSLSSMCYCWGNCPHLSLSLLFTLVSVPIPFLFSFVGSGSSKLLIDSGQRRACALRTDVLLTWVPQRLPRQGQSKEMEKTLYKRIFGIETLHLHLSWGKKYSRHKDKRERERKGWVDR